MYLNICEKCLTSVFIFCFKENWEKVPFFKVLDKETPLKLLHEKIRQKRTDLWKNN